MHQLVDICEICEKRRLVSVQVDTNGDASFICEKCMKEYKANKNKSINNKKTSLRRFVWQEV
jgi:ribosome-binding protein aMBF1 (putative translation factor)